MKSIRQTATELYKKNISAKMGYAITYGFFVLVAFVIAWFLPATLIITIPFFIIPLTYGLQLACADVNNGFPYRLKSLFIGYRIYFSPKGFGAYSALMGFLKFFGVYSVFNTITVAILVPIYTKIDPSFVDFINQFSTADYDQLPGLLQNFIESQVFLNIEFISASVGLFFGLYMFLHHMMSNSIKAEMSFYTPNSLPMQANKVLHKIGFRTFRKPFYKDYYANLWPMIVLYVLAYIGGCFLGYFVIASDNIQLAGYQIRLIALAIVLLVNMAFLPYFCDVMECLYKRHAKDYERASVNGILENLDELLKQKDLSEEERTMLEDFKKKKEETKQDTDDKKPDDKQ